MMLNNFRRLLASEDGLDDTLRSHAYYFVLGCLSGKIIAH